VIHSKSEAHQIETSDKRDH